MKIYRSIYSGFPKGNTIVSKRSKILGLLPFVIEQPFHRFKPCSITSILSPKILDPALANECVSFREFSTTGAVNFPKNTPNKPKEGTKLSWK